MLVFFEKHKDVLAVFSEKEDGTMKGYDLPNAMQNRKKFFKKNKIWREKIILSDQIHGSKVKNVSRMDPDLIKNTDSLVTKEKNIFLEITTADCIPVYFFDPGNKVIGLAHAGWRGLLDGIIENTISEIKKQDGKIDSLEIVLGPGIGKCHFEIKDDILDKFDKFKKFVMIKDSKTVVDLKGIIKSQLIGLGAKEVNIFDCNVCTYCDDRFFSYRRDKPKETEAMIAILGMKKN